MQILTADDSHAAELSRMAREYFTEADPEHRLPFDAAAFEAECQRLFHSKEPGWGVRVAVADDELAAFVVYAFVEDGQALMIYELYVRPQARRQGVGRALVEDVLAAAAARGVEYAGTAVNGQNTRSFQFLQALGFEVNRYLMGRRGNLAAPTG
jgi:ribosomal protein S18 acetylase RimI-like enzyme